MKKLIIQTVFALLCLLAASLPAWAGWVMVDQSGEKNLISQGRIKTVPQDASEGYTVMDFKKGQVLIVNLEEKTYAEASLDQFCKAMQQVMAKIHSMFNQVEQPKKAQKVEVIKQGPGGKIAGFNTTKYKVMVDGKLKEEVWLTVEPDFVKEFDPTMLSKLMACAAQPEDPESSPAYQKMIASGWLLRSIDYEGAEADTQTDVTKLSKQDIPESEFQVPQGYKKTTVDSILMGK